MKNQQEAASVEASYDACSPWIPLEPPGAVGHALAGSSVAGETPTVVDLSRAFQELDRKILPGMDTVGELWAGAKSLHCFVARRPGPLVIAGGAKSAATFEDAAPARVWFRLDDLVGGDLSVRDADGNGIDVQGRSQGLATSVRVVTREHLVLPPPGRNEVANPIAEWSAALFEGDAELEAHVRGLARARDSVWAVAQAVGAASLLRRVETAVSERLRARLAGEVAPVERAGRNWAAGLDRETVEALTRRFVAELRSLDEDAAQLLTPLEPESPRWWEALRTLARRRESVEAVIWVLRSHHRADAPPLSLVVELDERARLDAEALLAVSEGGHAFDPWLARVAARDSADWWGWFGADLVP